MELLREVPLARVEVGQVELRCNPDSQAAPPGWTPCARLPWLTGARKRTQCGRTASQRVRQGWHGRRRCSLARRTHALSGTIERRAWRARPCPRSLQLRQKQKGVNHGPFAQKAPQRPPVARSHCAGSTNGGTSWLASAGVHYAVCTLCRCTRPEGQSPDLTSNTHREVQLTRSAAHTRAAGQRLRRAADPTAVPGRRAAAGAHDVWHGRVRATSTWLRGAA